MVVDRRMVKTYISRNLAGSDVPRVTERNVRFEVKVSVRPRMRYKTSIGELTMPLSAAHAIDQTNIRIHLQRIT